MGLREGRAGGWPALRDPRAPRQPKCLSQGNAGRLPVHGGRARAVRDVAAAGEAARPTDRMQSACPVRGLGNVRGLLPHLASIVDAQAFVHTLRTDVFNHGVARLVFNTGSARFGCPSKGSWMTYGLRIESPDLAGFVVLRSGQWKRMGGTNIWGSSCLPTSNQGVECLRSTIPILNLSSLSGYSGTCQAARAPAIEFALMGSCNPGAQLCEGFLR